MSFLIVFLIIWVVAPGPIAFLTLNRARSQGMAAGIAIAVGAAITTGLIFGTVILVELLHVPIEQFSTSRVPQIFGALLIILLGVHAAYKAFLSPVNCSDVPLVKSKRCGENNQLRHNIVQGMLIALSGVPQSIIFYIILIPQTVAVDQIQSVTVAFGFTKMAFTLCWYSGVAGMVAYAQNWLSSPKIGRRFDFATAFCMVGFGINILL